MKLLSKILAVSLPLMVLGLNKHLQHAQLKSVNIDGIDFTYYIYGHGEPLVLIMGFRGTMSMWDPAFLNLLAQKYTLILFDNRGAGLSGDTYDNYTTISQMAQDTFKLIKALKYKKVHVLGWSMGSMIAQLIAITYPEIVKSLILCAPYPAGSHMHFGNFDDLMKMASPKTRPEELLEVLFPKTTSGKKAAAMYAKRIMQAIASGHLPNDLEVSPQTIKRQIMALMLWGKDSRAHKLLSKIKMPTLIAAGSNDDIDPVENVQAMQQALPQAWMVNFPGCGHNFLSQNYQEAAQVIQAFIESSKEH